MRFKKSLTLDDLEGQYCNRNLQAVARCSFLAIADISCFVVL